MTEIEKIKQYIERTKIDEKTYSLYYMRAREWAALANSDLSISVVVALAFNYGLAKGYRAGIKEAKRV